VPATLLQSAEAAAAKSESKSITYEIRTKSAKSGGLETNAPRETISGPESVSAVRRLSHEGPGLLRFLRPEKSAENFYRRRSGGEGGIRNRGTVLPISRFATRFTANWRSRRRVAESLPGRSKAASMAASVIASTGKSLQERFLVARVTDRSFRERPRVRRCDSRRGTPRDLHLQCERGARAGARAGRPTR
jgi:hypothetical protein